MSGITSQIAAYTLIGMADKFQSFFYGDADDVTFTYKDLNGQIQETTVPNVNKVIDDIRSNGVTTDDLTTVLSDFYDKTAINELLASYYTQDEINSKLDDAINSFKQSVERTRLAFTNERLGNGQINAAYNFHNFMLDSNWAREHMFQTKTYQTNRPLRNAIALCYYSVSSAYDYSAIFHINGDYIRYTGSNPSRYDDNDDYIFSGKSGGIRLPEPVKELYILDGGIETDVDIPVNSFIKLKNAKNTNLMNAYVPDTIASGNASIIDNEDGTYTYNRNDESGTGRWYIVNHNKHFFINQQVTLSINLNGYSGDITLGVYYGSYSKVVRDGDILTITFWCYSNKTGIYLEYTDNDTDITISDIILSYTDDLLLRNFKPINTGSLILHGDDDISPTYKVEDITDNTHIFIEKWVEDVELRDVVFRYGNVNNPYDLYNNIRAVEANWFDDYLLYMTLGDFENNLPEDKRTIGLGFRWSELSTSEKELLVNDKDNNIFFKDGKWYQVRYRTRVVQGLLDNHTLGYTDNSKLDIKSEYVTRLSPKSHIDYNDDQKNDFNITYSYGLYGGSSTSLISGESILSLGGYSTNFNVSHIDADFYGLIPLMEVRRRNAGIYHPTLNNDGSAAIYYSGELRFWFNVPNDYITSLEDCFNPTLIAALDEDNNIVASSDESAVIRTGYLLSNISGRDDGFYADTTSRDDVIDKRMNANVLSTESVRNIYREQINENKAQIIENDGNVQIGYIHGNLFKISDNSSEFDHQYTKDPMVLDNVNDAGEHYMYYSGYNGGYYRIGLAISKDGINWNKQGIVLDLGDDGESKRVFTPFVIKNADDDWNMYYTGTASDTLGDIYLATSTDGINWDRQGKVVARGTDGEFDDYSIEDPCILKRDDDDWIMYYTGKKDSGSYSLGYATSTDGVNWDKQGVLILYQTAIALPFYKGVKYANIIKNDSGDYEMFYNNADSYLKYATSIDGINWEDHGDFMYKNYDSNYTTSYVINGSVIKDKNGIYKLYHSGYGNLSNNEYVRNGYTVRLAYLFSLECLKTNNYAINKLQSITYNNKLYQRRDYTNTFKVNTKMLFIGDLDILGIHFSNYDKLGQCTDKNIYIVEHYRSTIKLNLSLDVKNVLVLDSDGVITKVDYIYDITTNIVTITTPFDDLGYVSQEEMDSNIRIMVTGIGFVTPSTLYDPVKDNLTVDSNLTLSASEKAKRLTEGLLNKVQTSDNIYSIFDIPVKYSNIAYLGTSNGLVGYDGINIYDDYLTNQTSPNNFSNLGLLYMLNTYRADSTMALNLLYRELTMVSPTSTHSPVAVNTISDETLYKYGMIMTIGYTNSYDSRSLFTPTVYLDSDGQFTMYYVGHNVGYDVIRATSKDGVSWVKHEVVLSKGADGEFDDYYIFTPFVVKNADDDYEMWYTGYDGSTYRIGYATSTDGVNWDKQGVVLDIGDDGDFDDKYVRSANVVKNADDDYEMWYTGYDGSTYRIGYATSTDGVTWSKQGMVLDIGDSGEFDDKYVYSSSVIKNADDDYEMVYKANDGSNTRLGYATSTDGITWSKTGLLIDRGIDGEFDSINVNDPAFLKDEDGEYYIFYSAYGNDFKFPGYGIGLATTKNINITTNDDDIIGGSDNSISVTNDNIKLFDGNKYVRHGVYNFNTQYYFSK